MQTFITRRVPSKPGCAAMAYAARLAIGAQHLPPLDAQPGLEGTRRVVNVCMNHLAVTRADASANGRGRLKHHHLICTEPFTLTCTVLLPASTKTGVSDISNLERIRK